MLDVMNTLRYKSALQSGIFAGRTFQKVGAVIEKLPFRQLSGCPQHSENSLTTYVWRGVDHPSVVDLTSLR